jgi:hypothetical protein
LLGPKLPETKVWHRWRIDEVSEGACTDNLNTDKHELSDEYLSKQQQMPRPPDHTNTAPISSGGNQASGSHNASSTIKENVSKAVPKWLQKGLLKK